MLALLLALACSDKKPDVEALSAQVIAQPITTLEAGVVGELGDFAPVYPGQLTPPEGFGDAEGLRPLLVGPQGEAEGAGQAVVVFDRPMVALSALGSAPVPLSCAPGSGRARWAGTSTAVWVPHEGAFPLASELRCTVPKGTAAADGTALERALEFTFTTPRPAVLRARLEPSSSEVAPDKPIVLVFNQGVDPDEVARAVTLRPSAGGRALTVSATRPQGKAGEPAPRNAERSVELRAPMARDTEYTLTVSRTLRGLEGPRTLAEDWSTTFQTLPPARVTSFGPKGTAVSPYTWLSIGMSTTFDGAALGAKVRIEPPPPDGFKPAQDYASRELSQGLRLEPMTTYTVTLAPGAKDEHGQELTEGVSWSFTTGHYEPLLHAPDGTQLYPANNPPELPLRSRNLEDLYTRVSAVDADWVVKHALGYSVQEASAGSYTPLFADRPLDDAIHIDPLDLRPYLSGGRGLVLVETWSPQVRDWQDSPVVQRALLQVTDLGASLKLGPEGLSTWVTRLSDGAPVADAEVRVLLSGDKPRALWTGRTDAQGLASAALTLPEDWSEYSDERIVVLVSQGSDRVVTRLGGPNGLPLWRYGVWSGGDRPRAEELRLHAFTDRGVYKPGETVHVAWTTRVAGRAGLARPAAGTWSWRCEDARGAALGQGQGPLAAHGGGSFDLALPPELAYGTGTCSVEVEAGELSGSATLGVPVRAYRTPAFRVDVEAPERGLVGEALGFTGRGAYLFGAAMRGAEVKWTATATETTPQIPGYEDWSFRASADSWWSDGGSGFENLGSGEGVLDADGGLQVPVTLRPKLEARAWDVQVELTVTDPARQRISNRAALVVDPADFYVGLRARSSVARAGSATTVDLIGVTRAGEVRDGQSVELKVVRRTWDTVRQKDMDGSWTWVSTAKDEPVLSRSVTTARQAVPVEFTPQSGGYYVVQARAKDAQGRLTQAEEGLWVAGEGASWARGEDNQVQLQADRREYKPGDVAKILVRAPKAGLWGLVSVEREGVLSRQVVRFESTAQTVDIPLGEDAVPNLFVSVLLVEGAPPVDSPRGGIPDWYLGYTELKVSPAGRRLAVDLSTDRQTYQPGETVQVQVKVQGGGAPQAGARVVLYAVDYGVLSLTGYELPNAFDTYYAPHRLAVLVADSRTRVLNRAEYLVKGAAAGGGGAEEEGFVRSKFVTTPFWAPDGVTDANGVLSTSFELPHNLTTFQIMAVVDGGADRFGAASRQVQVSRPLIARPALPRLLRVGDRALAGIVVHNNRDEARDVAVVAEAQGVTLAGSPVTVTVPAHGAVEVPFALTDPQAGEATFRFDIQAGKDRDTVEVKLPVVRPQPAETVATAGVVEGLATEQLALASGVLPGVGGLDLRLSSTVLVGVEDSLGYLVEYPHGCLEQTSSRLLALLLVRELGPRVDAGLDAAKIERYLTEGFASLGRFAHASGGYAMWPGGEPSGLATAYVAELLRLAQKPVPDDTVQFLRAFLAGRYVPTWWDADTRLTAQARAALALARLGQGDAGFNARLYAARGKLSLSARGELLETLARTTGADKRTADLLRDLEGHLTVEADRAVLHDKTAGRWTALWAGDALPTATALYGILALDARHPLAPRLARGLVTERERGFWGNTYTTARSLQALAAYAQAVEADGAVRGTVTLAGKELLSAALGPDRRMAEVEVPIGQLQAGELRLQSQGRLYYEARLSYALAEMPPRDEGFTLTRTYRIVEGGGSGGQVTPGSLVQVTLAITTPIDRSGVAVIDPLPAGLEAVDSFFATTATGLEEDVDSGYTPRDTASGELGEPLQWSSWVFNHRELRDDGLYLYADWMPAGVHTYTWYARATTPGDYAQPAALVEEMYRPEIFGRTEAGRFVVGAGPVAQAE